MKLINAIIVDDEPDARDVLNSLMQMADYNVNLLASCENVPDAVLAIKKYQPDVVFLDVQMPNYAGYEIVQFFDKIDFEIVFVTAFDQYAIKAFDLSAIDYLVKPVDRKRLNNTLKRLSEKLSTDNSIEAYQNLLESLKEKEFKKLVISELGSKKIIAIDDIVCIKGDGSYATIYFKNHETLTVSKNLKYFESILSENKTFFRAQKSWIINLELVVSYNLSNGTLTMPGNIEAKISVNRIGAFEEWIKNT